MTITMNHHSLQETIFDPVNMQRMQITFLHAIYPSNISHVESGGGWLMSFTSTINIDVDVGNISNPITIKIIEFYMQNVVWLTNVVI